MNTSFFLGAGVPILSSLLPREERKNSLQDRLNIRIVIYQRALAALTAFEKKRFSAFDANPKDQACQIRALQLCQVEVKDLSDVKRRIEERLDLLSLIFTSNKSCHDHIKGIEQDVNKPFCEERYTLNQERQKALQGITQGSPLYHAITQAFRLRFDAVKKRKMSTLAAKINPLKNAKEKIMNQWIEEDSLDLVITPPIMLIIRCYLVTLVKVDKIRKKIGLYEYKEGSDPKLLGKGTGLEISKQASTQVIDQAKKAICLESIAYVQEQAVFIERSRANLLCTLLPQPRPITSKGREELPFFHLTQVLFLRAMQQQIPIFLKVRNIASYPLEQQGFGCSVLFKSTGEAYKLSEIFSTDLLKRVIVIEAYSKVAFEHLVTQKYIDDVLEESGGLLRLIDLNTAQHRQYTDQTADESLFCKIPEIDSQEEKFLIDLFCEAVKKGFSLENPALLCIDHVYCDLLKNQRGVQ